MVQIYCFWNRLFFLASCLGVRGHWIYLKGGWRRAPAPLNMPLKPESGPVCDLHGSVWDEGVLPLLLRLLEVSLAIAKSMSHLKQPIETEKSLGGALTHINTAWGCAHKHGGKLGLGFIQSGDRKSNAGGEFGTWFSILRPNRKFGKVFDWLFYFTVFVVLKVLRALLLLLGLSTLLHGARNATPKQQSRPKGQRVKLALDRLVWPELSGRTPLSMANMSLSPWTYKWGTAEDIAIFPFG